jgi:three-Cys-motif partner protein
MFQLQPPEDDGLLIPEVGGWSKDKHYFLGRYLDAFTTAMKGKAWSSLHYIDLFAGAGIERIEATDELDWGSPMIAAQVPHPFSRLHLGDHDGEKHRALMARVSRSRPDSQIVSGDANQAVRKIIQVIPPGSLSVAFLDPYGLHLWFETLRVLATKRTDLIIFFPDHLDALRNCEFVYRDNPNSNLDRVLGEGADWRSIFDKPSSRWAEELRKLYVRQIRSLGYQYFEYERIAMKGRPLYLLIFCSKDKAGGDIWRKTAVKKPDGQRTLEFPPPG